MRSPGYSPSPRWDQGLVWRARERESERERERERKKRDRETDTQEGGKRRRERRVRDAGKQIEGHVQGSGEEKE